MARKSDFRKGTEDLTHLTLSREIPAPRQDVFRAWTSDAICSWWGPEGFTNPVCKIDAREGGEMRIDMKGPDGKTYPMTGTYMKIEEPEMLEFQSTALDEHGKKLFDVMNTVSFAESGNGTKLTLHAKVSNAVEGADVYLKGMDQGWNQSIDRLSGTLKGE